MASGYVLALDLGTTGNRAFVFDRTSAVVGSAYKELTQFYPQPGWVEHDPDAIWQDTLWVMHSALKTAGIAPAELRAIGLTVQRETCLLWDKTTGKPLHPAIVWQDRRTASLCEQLQQQGHAAEIFERTGLVLDAYFSATKLNWLLQHLAPPALDRVLAGTIDSWILWNLTRGRVHATDHSNASRTLLMNLHTGQWDSCLLDLFQIPAAILPPIQPSLSHFGVTDRAIVGAEIPITAILGDQQAALFGQGCDRPGLMKCTYGTGCFLVAHTGTAIARSSDRLISTVAWSQPHAPIGYALEGSMFTTGACIQWLRDGLHLITTAAETETLATAVSDSGGVYFVPALSGLGAPHWDMSARGAFFGLTRGIQRPHLVRSVLEAIAFQVKEVVQAIETCHPSLQLNVDGGACANNFLMQLQADLLGIAIVRPRMRDTTAQGAAFAAGLSSGFWDNYTNLIQQRAIDRIFEPGAGQPQALETFAIWQTAVDRTKNWPS